ncbi:MAG: endonuclease [Bacilli bacterium]|nr:endonuclease [Bacilli bacterium]
MEEKNETLNVEKGPTRVYTPKKIILIVAAVIGTLILVLVGYVGYILLSYYRIGDQKLTISGTPTKEVVNTDEELSIVTYNIGFGAYSQDYTFFLDTGYDDEGKETCGHWSTGRSYKEVKGNTDGAIKTVKDLDPDFALFQEVDTHSSRSYGIDQDKAITTSFTNYSHTHAVNFHTAYLPYPLYDMHGSVNAGLTTVSKYKINNAERKQYTIADDLSKLFDLDRCFSTHELNMNNGKKLCIVNSHMSAYDKGGVIRETQMKELNTFLKAHYEAGDYVIVGGDYNHDLLTYNPDYSYNATDNRPFGMTKKAPDWVSYFYNEEGKTSLTEGYDVAASDNNPTCRNNDIEWDPAKTFVTCVDGFIVSDNIEVTGVEVIQTKNGKKGLDGFAYSDHEPVRMTFKLLA